MTMNMIKNKIEVMEKGLVETKKQLNEVKKIAKLITAYGKAYDENLELNEWDRKALELEEVVQSYKNDIAKAKKALKLLVEVQELTA